MNGGWRRAQEPTIRFAASAVFLLCAWMVCTALGEVSVSSWFGWLFGLLISGGVASVFWGRELQEVQVRRDRAANAARGTGRLRVRDEDDDVEAAGPALGSVRPLRIPDNDDD